MDCKAWRGAALAVASLRRLREKRRKQARDKDKREFAWLRREEWQWREWYQLQCHQGWMQRKTYADVRPSREHKQLRQQLRQQPQQQNQEDARAHASPIDYSR